jgi:putative heme-binding domain-containing protein
MSRVIWSCRSFSGPQNALQTLLLKRPADLVPALHSLLSDPSLRGPALRGLASYDDAKTPKLILDQYANFSSDEKADAVQTLSSRAGYALALLQAVEKKQVPREDLSNFTVRQLRALNEESVTGKLNELWGQVRPAAADKVALMDKYRKLLTPAYLKKADKSQGRAVYLKSCAVCHRLFDDGGSIGPDITGSQRHNLDYLLENILDPSAVVPSEFQVAIVVTTAGRTLTGLVKQETERAVTLQTQNELIIVPKGEVESLTRTKTSMMPDGLLDNLRAEEVRDLMAYLASSTQVPLPRPAGKK